MKMMLVEWWFLLLAIPAIEGSLRLWKPKGFSREERVMKQIQETCYVDNDFKELILISGDFDEVIDKASVMRMNNLLNVDESYEFIGLTKVLMNEDSPERLHSDLISFKKTRWWTHMLTFFIIGKNDDKCENFEEILNTAWEMNIINSIYICSESENTTLYTLNPITHYAPDPWKRMEDLNHSSIYHQVFDPDTSCNNLNYDKTKVLNGYRIKSIFATPGVGEEPVDPSPAFRFYHLIMRQLNVSVMNETVNSSDLKHHLEDGNGDVTHENLIIVTGDRLSPLFPIGEVRCVVLVKSNEGTVLQKIHHSWTTSALRLSAIALIFLFYVLVKKNGVTSATLDIIRFLTYVPIRTDKRSNSFRIYFATMLIFIVMTNGILQGKIAAFLTTTDKILPLKTMGELTDAGYHFYVFPSCRKAVPPELHLSESNDTHIHNRQACIDYVLYDTLNACIIPTSQFSYRYLSKDEMHHVRPRVEIVYSYSWMSRRDWLLYERFNSMLIRLFECGIDAHFEDLFRLHQKNQLEINDRQLALAEIQPPYKPIKLAKLNFAFKLLTVGLSLAMFVLIAELRMREI